MSTVNPTIPVRRREVDQPGRWRRFGKQWARALYSQRQRGYIASTYNGDAEGPAMGTGVSVFGVYPTADAALDAAGTLLGLSEERVCNLAEIDRARRERAKVRRKQSRKERT